MRILAFLTKKFSQEIVEREQSASAFAYGVEEIAKKVSAATTRSPRVSFLEREKITNLRRASGRRP
jgi:hypothetical protein